MKLVLVDKNGQVYDVTKNIETYDLNKSLAASQVILDIKNTLIRCAIKCGCGGAMNQEWSDQGGVMYKCHDCGKTVYTEVKR